MRKILKNTPKTRAYLDSLPTMFLVCYRNRFGVISYPFTGKYIKCDGVDIPLVYVRGSISDDYYLSRIDRAAINHNIVVWTQFAETAYRIANTFNE